MSRICRLVTVLVLMLDLAFSAAGAARAASIRTFQVPTAGSDLNTITAGPDGNLYFTEDQDTTVDGQLTFHIGELTTGGQLTEIPVPFGDSDSSGDRMGPTSIVSSGGEVWFLSDVGETLYTYVPGASSVQAAATFGFSDNGEKLAPAPGGGVWMTTEPGDQAGLIAPDGSATFQSINSRGVPGTVVENPNGGIDYADGGSSINYVDAAGATASYPLPSSIGGGDVYSMIFDRSGNLWYSAYNDSTLTGCFDATLGVLPAGQATAHTVVSMDPPSGHGPCATDLALGPDGAVWFTWTSTPDGVHTKMPSGVGRLDPRTGRVTYVDTVESDSLLPSSLAFGANGSLYFLDNLDNLVGEIGAPETLFTGATSPGAAGKQAPDVTLGVATQRLQAVRSAHALTVSCTLAAAGTCRVTATVTAAVARTLHLKVTGAARTFTLATASHTLKHGGKTTLKLMLPPDVAKALGRVKRLTVSLVARSSVTGARSRSVTRTLTLR